MSVAIRAAAVEDILALAQLWHGGWHEAHAAIVPSALTRLRTLASFRDRLRDGLAMVRVAGSLDVPTGFAMVRKDELYQIYVDKAARGGGVAGALIAHAEERIRAGGQTRAWLDCAVGNKRAAAFYRKRGWMCQGITPTELDTSEGPFELEVWRFEKAL